MVLGGARHWQLEFRELILPCTLLFGLHEIWQPQLFHGQIMCGISCGITVAYDLAA